MQDQSIVELILSILISPFRFIWGFIVFMVFAWTTSRSGRAFIFALPAMFFAVLCVAAVWAVGFKGDMKAFGLSVGRYTKASDPEEINYNPDAALLYAKKMVQTDPENGEYSKYELALSYERLEEVDQAYEIMKWIAPDKELDTSKDELGLSDAYFWLAGYYVNEDNSDWPEEERKAKARKQMELAYKANPKNVLAVLGLAGMNKEDADNLKEEVEELRNKGQDAEANELNKLAEKQLDDAVEYLKESISLDLISERQLYASNILIDILQSRGKDREAELMGLKFINSYEALAENNPDVLPFWISIVKVCIQIGDFERGEKYILKGYQLAQAPEARNALAKLAAQIEIEKAKTHTDMEDETEFLKRLYALADGIKTDVNVPEGYDEILYYIDGFDGESEKDIWIRDSLLGDASNEDLNKSDSRVTGVIHILLGIREAIEDSMKAAKNDWEIASQQLPSTPFAINNLIRKYVDIREVDLETREKLLGLAIELFPQEAIFYASRGRYYIGDEDFEKAVEDLEFANSRISGAIPILRDLVTAYEGLENQEKADEYQAEIEELEVKRENGDNFLDTFSSS